MADEQTERFGEFRKHFLGDEGPGRDVVQRIACLAGLEPIQVAARGSLGEDAVPAVIAFTAGRVLACPAGDLVRPVAWRRSSLVETAIEPDSSNWEETWRLGYPPLTRFSFRYSSGHVLGLTTPAPSEESRRYLDRFRSLLDELLSDGSGVRD